MTVDPESRGPDKASWDAKGVRAAGSSAGGGARKGEGRASPGKAPETRRVRSQTPSAGRTARRGRRPASPLPTRQTPGKADFRRVRLLVLDVDGVLTDGRIIWDSSGTETKQFHVRDGSAIKWLIRAGVQVAWLTGRSSPVVDRRADELGVREVVQGAKQKLPAFLELLRRTGCQPEEVCYVGDDLPDIPVLTRVGLPCAVADAAAEVRALCQVVTRAPGGGGAVREIAERILRAQGLWEELLLRYQQA